MKYIKGLAFLLAFGAIPCARADVTVLDSAASFSAAVTGVQSFGFGGLTFSGQALAGNRLIGGATFSSPGSAYTLRAGFSGAQYGVDFFSGQGIPSQVNVGLANLYAFSFEFGSYAVSPGSLVTIALNSGQQISRSLLGTASFIGFVSTVPLTSVTFTTVAQAMDIVRFQTASPVPEVQTWLLLVAGLATLRVARRVTTVRSQRG